MKFRAKLFSTVRFLKNTVYRGPIQRAASRTGIESQLAAGYSRLVSTVQGDTITYTVAGTTARYHNTRFLPWSPPEEGMLENVMDAIEPGDTFYDLGANRGIYTCLVGNKVKSFDGQVVSFEPNPPDAKVLRENIALNNLDEAVVVKEAAVSDADGEMEFKIAKSSTGNTLAVTADDTDGEIVTVDTVRIDTLFENGEIPPPDVIKIDVEGAELNAFRGLQNTLDGSSCRVVYCEIHEDVLSELGGSPDKIKKILEDCGFNLETVFERSSTQYILRGER